MKAAVLFERGAPLVIEDLAIDKPAPREVLIRVVGAGVCHSDLHIADGSFPAPLPAVLGHEVAGVVEAIGDEVRAVAVGDHVVTCVSGFCGHCEDCVTGHLSLCQSRVVERPRGAPPRLALAGRKVHQIGGLAGFAEMMVADERACVAIRRDMPLDLASVIGCAVTTGYGAVAHTAKVDPGSTVAVIGCGGVGLMIVNAALIAGAARIIAIDRVPAKLALAGEMGATDLIDAAEGDIVERVRELTGGGVHYSFEAIGLKPTVEQSFRMLRQGGTATVVGVAPVGTSFEIGAMDLLRERKLQGSYMGSNRFTVDMPRLVDLYMQGRLKLDRLVARRIVLDEVNDAFAEMKTGQHARSVIRFPA